MATDKNVSDSIGELIDNLGTIGLFMVGEVRSFLRKSWGSSKEEFMAELEKVGRSMKHSGKWAAEDVERAADQIRKNWDLVDKMGSLEWEKFLGDVKARLEGAGEVTRETFDQAVDLAKNTLDRHWEATGRVGEDSINYLRRHSEKMANAFKEQWGVFGQTMDKTGKKVDRAVQAAWEELTKKD
jgi:hypothetical protein